MKISGVANKERVIALFIDNLIAIALTFFLMILVPEKWPVLKGIVLVSAYLGYFILFEGMWSRTPGKYFQGLMVRKVDGRKIDWRSAFVRGITRIIEINPVLLGGFPAGIIIISSDRKQRVGDMLAGTVVVSDKITWTAEDYASDHEEKVRRTYNEEEEDEDLAI
jgi:uncharacterized RDD family membrane protein YckC